MQEITDLSHIGHFGALVVTNQHQLCKGEHGAGWFRAFDCTTAPHMYLRFLVREAWKTLPTAKRLRAVRLFQADQVIASRFMLHMPGRGSAFRARLSSEAHHNPRLHGWLFDDDE